MLNEKIEEFVLWYESLLEKALDPFRREINGDYVDCQIGEEAFIAMKKAYAIRKSGLPFLSSIDEIAYDLLHNTNQCVAILFLKSSHEYVYMPDLLCYKNDVKKKILAIVG